LKKFWHSFSDKKLNEFMPCKKHCFPEICLLIFGFFGFCISFYVGSQLNPNPEPDPERDPSSKSETSTRYGSGSAKTKSGTGTGGAVCKEATLSVEQ
jgi:hypothetical protein